MLNSLYSRLAAALTVLFLLVGIAFVAVGLYASRMYEMEVDQKLNRDLAKQIVSQRSMIRDKHIDERALEDVFHMLMVVNPRIELYLLSPEGKILAFSAEPGKVKREKIDTGPIKRFLSQKASLPIPGDDPRHRDKKKIFSAARIPEDGNLEGYLYIILGGEVYDSVIDKLQRSYILRVGLYGVVATVFVAALTGLIIFACLTRRLHTLARSIVDYKEGKPLRELDLPSPKGKRSDEIDVLTDTFVQMAGRLEEQVASLKNADSMRRELVANISHDLRTPVTTLQGYMETLLMKDDQLTAEERRKYVDLALSHCRRLGSLVSDLFELAKLESKDALIHAEPFSLGELVQDVVQKFHLRSEEKKIRIFTNIGIGIPFVHADIALIERVLENLIENALRHTPEGGTVSIVLAPVGDGVTVNVSDTGSGIPEEEIPRIFDRFYRIGKSGRDKTEGSGLGLAIAKQILDLHGSPIHVRSVPNHGTTFTFTLPFEEQLP